MDYENETPQPWDICPKYQKSLNNYSGENSNIWDFPCCVKTNQNHVQDFFLFFLKKKD